MNIIVKRQASHSMFRPHYNHAIGSYIHTKDDYMKALKEKHLEPFKVQPEKESKKYKMSQKGAEMIKYAAECEKKRRKPDGRFVKALNDLGIAKKPKWLTDAESLTNRTKQGGFHNEG